MNNERAYIRPRPPTPALAERIGRGTGIWNTSPKKFRHQILPFYPTAPSGRGTGAPARLTFGFGALRLLRKRGGLCRRGRF